MCLAQLRQDQDVAHLDLERTSLTIRYVQKPEMIVGIEPAKLDSKHLASILQQPQLLHRSMRILRPSINHPFHFEKGFWPSRVPTAVTAGKPKYERTAPNY